jgi:hypothetical protein
VWGVGGEGEGGGGGGQICTVSDLICKHREASPLDRTLEQFYMTGHKVYNNKEIRKGSPKRMTMHHSYRAIGNRA